MIVAYLAANTVSAETPVFGAPLLWNIWPLAGLVPLVMLTAASHAAAMSGVALPSFPYPGPVAACWSLGAAVSRHAIPTKVKM